MRVMLVHNPTAGDEDHSGDWLSAAIAEAGHDVRYHSLDDDWEGALAEQPDLVAVAGGDGSVRKVFRELAGTGVAAALIPLGSANNIARTLGLEPVDDRAEAARLVRSWQEGTRRPYDVGLLATGGAETRFVESAGGGLFAEVLATAEAIDSDPDGREKIEHGLGLLRRTIEEHPPLRWDLELDGERFSAELLGVEAMNVGELGPNVALAPGADPGDGLLDVALIHAEHADDLRAYVESRLDDREASAPQLERRRGRRLVMRCPDGARLHADDDLWSDGSEQRDEAVASVGLLRLDVLVA
jgi:diacylglycerol kinase family enzyme